MTPLSQWPPQQGVTIKRFLFCFEILTGFTTLANVNIALTRNVFRVPLEDIPASLRKSHKPDLIG